MAWMQPEISATFPLQPCYPLPRRRPRRLWKRVNVRRWKRPSRESGQLLRRPAACSPKHAMLKRGHPYGKALSEAISPVAHPRLLSQSLGSPPVEHHWSGFPAVRCAVLETPWLVFRLIHRSADQTADEFTSSRCPGSGGVHDLSMTYRPLPPRPAEAGLFLHLRPFLAEHVATTSSFTASSACGRFPLGAYKRAILGKGLDATRPANVRGSSARSSEPRDPVRYS